ncbi:MAG: hypothetical protein V3V92_03320, partial [Candidatus Hydrothermarchaeales archaeon]
MKAKDLVLFFTILIFIVGVMPIGYGDSKKEENIYLDVPSDPVFVSFGETARVPVNVENRGENGVVVSVEMEENNMVNRDLTSGIVLHPDDLKSTSMRVTCKEGVAGPSVANINVLIKKYDSDGELNFDLITSERLNVNCEKGNLFQRKPFVVITVIFAL